MAKTKKYKTIKINDVWEIDIAPCRKCKKIKVRGLFGYCKDCLIQFKKDKLKHANNE